MLNNKQRMRDEIESLGCALALCEADLLDSNKRVEQLLAEVKQITEDKRMMLANWNAAGKRAAKAVAALAIAVETLKDISESHRSRVAIRHTAAEAIVRINQS